MFWLTRVFRSWNSFIVRKHMRHLQNSTVSHSRVTNGKISRIFINFDLITDLQMAPAIFSAQADCWVAAAAAADSEQKENFSAMAEPDWPPLDWIQLFHSLVSYLQEQT